MYIYISIYIILTIVGGSSTAGLREIDTTVSSIDSVIFSDDTRSDHIPNA